MVEEEIKRTGADGAKGFSFNELNKFITFALNVVTDFGCEVFRIKVFGG